MPPDVLLQEDAAKLLEPGRRVVEREEDGFARGNVEPEYLHVTSVRVLEAVGEMVVHEAREFEDEAVADR